MPFRTIRKKFRVISPIAQVGGAFTTLNYLLRDLFNTDRAAGAVNGTAAEPGPGTRTVVDTNGIVTLSGGGMVMNGTNAAADRLTYAALTRAAGRLLKFDITDMTSMGASSGSTRTGLVSAAGASIDIGMDFGGGFGRVKSGVSALFTPHSYISSDDFFLYFVMKATGGYLLVKKNSGAIELLWVYATGSSDLLFQVYLANAESHNFQIDNVASPDRLYLPPVLAYDTFTRANGALGNSEATGPDAQAVTARAWTGATWAVASNVAVNTPVAGSDLIVNGGFAADTDWTKGAGWTIAAGVATATGGISTDLTAAVAPLTLGAWYEIAYTISGFAAGTCAVVIGAFVAQGNGSNGTKAITGRATSTALALRGAGFTGNADNLSAKALTLSELFASLQVSVADVLADVNATITANAQGGLVLNLDSAATPANFVIAYHDGQRAILEKCVAGTYTTVISANATYSAGATLRVIKSGTSYALYYNGAQVGATSTISDAGIISNTLHGLFSTSGLNSLDGLSIHPRGTNGEYEGLSDF